ncbi:hypothetical protein T07_13977 [Trichinella nelsoni]|uniref:Uncharacterized protein n=1 Tax=Trichinella nelsoni TaxID=6336 RepID=A0A0V0RNB1_9BILA|nr:hypothetical protein T07_13977 [Trichinella nelsoni]
MNFICCRAAKFHCAFYLSNFGFCLSRSQATGCLSQLRWQSCIEDEPQAPRSDP